MARPTGSTTVQRPDLGAIAYEYSMEAGQRGFIAERLLPTFNTNQQTGDYPVIPVEALIKLVDTARAERGDYNRGDFEFENDTYACTEYGWEEPLPDDEVRKYEGFYSQLDLDEVATTRATDKLLRGREKRVADLLFNSSTFTVHNVTNEWDDATSGAPLSDVQTGSWAIEQATGLQPNVLALSLTNFRALLVTAEIKDYLKYTNPMLISGFEAQKRIIAQYFGVDEILVGASIYDAAKKGKSVSATAVWSNEYALLARVSSGGMDLREPALGRTFLWTTDSPSMITTEQYREEQRRAEIYRVRHQVVEKLVFTGAAYLLGNVHS